MRVNFAPAKDLQAIRVKGHLHNPDINADLVKKGGHVFHHPPPAMQHGHSQFTTDESHDNPSTSSSMWCYPCCCGSPKIEVVCKVLLVVATIVLLFRVTLDQNSSLNRWQNTKSMHAADSTGSLAWVALLPGQVYMERGERFLEYKVQAAHDNDWEHEAYHRKLADHDNDWEHEAYHRKLLLAGGANILTNISSNVYVTAILFIYFLSLIDVKDSLIKFLAEKMPGVEADIPRNELTLVRLIFWGSWVIFVLVYLLRNYSVWDEVTWKADDAAKAVTIKYQWEFGGSAFYAMAVVAMYIWFIDYKSYHILHHRAQKIASSFFFASEDDKYHHEDKIKLVFTVCFFLVVMALLGQSRDIILETEAQICLLSTLAFCFLMIVTTRVQRFFMFVENLLIDRLQEDKSRISMVTHVQMTRQIVAVARGISLVVKFLLFGVIVHVLYNMKVERTTQSSLWYYLVIFTVVFMLLEFWEVGKMLYYSTSHELRLKEFGPKEKHKSGFANNSKHRYEIAHYVFLFFFLVSVVAILVLETNQHKGLFLYETAQHAYANTGIKTNSACSYGIQKNSMTTLYLDQKIKNNGPYTKIEMLDKSPIAFKLFAWTRWWTLDNILTSKYTNLKPGPDLYFCSTGLEQEFGLCRQQYTAKPGEEFRDPDFQTAAAQSTVTLVSSAPSAAVSVPAQPEGQVA
jgi:hypothetical protein